MSNRTNLIHFKNVNPINFDCDSLSSPSHLYGLECIMLDPFASEMSGTDCQTVYALDDKAFDALAKWNSELIFDASDAESALVKFGIDQQHAAAAAEFIATRGGKWFIACDEKSSLAPLCAEGAALLQEWALADYVPKKLDDDDSRAWYYEMHLPYIAEKLGRALLNARSFKAD